MRKKFVLYIMLFAVAVASCKKWEDKEADTDQLTRPYCNDPEAINYNWDFPGKPDNSVCIYPYQFFEGQYRFYDSTRYSADMVSGLYYEFDLTLKRQDTSRSKLILSGFCATDINFTADRYYKAWADSTKASIDDSTKLPGQLVCNPKDTLSGYITRFTDDTLRINFTVLTDTGLLNHYGKAVKKK